LNLIGISKNKYGSQKMLHTSGQKRIVIYGPPAVGKSTLIKSLQESGDSRLQHAKIVDLENVAQPDRPATLDSLLKRNSTSTLIIGAADLYPPEHFPWNDWTVVALIPENRGNYALRIAARAKQRGKPETQNYQSNRSGILKNCFENRAMVDCWLDPLAFDENVDGLTEEILAQTFSDSSRNSSTKRVLVASYPRSGGTWLFNAIRLIYKLHAPTTYGAWITEYVPQRKNGPHVVKLHDPGDLGDLSYDKVFTSRRNKEAIKESLIRMNELKGDSKKWFKSVDELHKILADSDRHYDHWKQHSCYEMDYHTMMEDKVAEIVKISQVLGLTLERSQAEQIHGELDGLSAHIDDLTSNDHDPFSLLHLGHVRQQERTQSC
jgi:hypothetical protein